MHYYANAAHVMKNANALWCSHFVVTALWSWVMSRPQHCLSCWTSPYVHLHPVREYKVPCLHSGAASAGTGWISFWKVRNSCNSSHWWSCSPRHKPLLHCCKTANSYFFSMTPFSNWKCTNGILTAVIYNKVKVHMQQVNQYKWILFKER